MLLLPPQGLPASVPLPPQGLAASGPLPLQMSALHMSATGGDGWWLVMPVKPAGHDAMQRAPGINFLVVSGTVA
jgi:hypothetical protein